MFIGGVHAREWGSSDILIFFLESILEGYKSNSSITFGNKTFNANQIKSIIDYLDLFIFPDVNPDGKYYSQNVDSMWRKNRAPTPNSGCKGVDINRNYAFLWNYRTYIHPDALIEVSDDPCSNKYHGTSPFSEAETQNVKYILDTYPNINFFIDIHCYSELILYSWGHDINQNDTQNMSYQNHNFNGFWGIKDDEIKNYIFKDDENQLVEIGNRMNNTLKAVRGKSYKVQQGFELYGTTGTSEDYAFNRHILDPVKAKLYSYTIEWGTEFQPDYDSEMTQIIYEISMVLIEFCLYALEKEESNIMLLVESALDMSKSFKKKN